jgi:hypothetical protein
VLIASYARKAGIPGRAGHATVTVPIPDRYLSHPERRVWSAPLAFKSLAVRVSMMFAERPNTVAESRVLSTEEMVVAGVRQGVGQQAEFAVHVAGPLSLPRADLPVDPYVLGAWLGDGSSGGGTITQGESAACTDQNGLTDRAFLIGQLVDAGIDASASTSIDKSINTRGLATKLRQAGVLRDKHIPMAYLRASADQRLSLLQGLMDTDGTVDKNGACELCLCDERLITGALELIRSLGIKASISSGPAVLTEPDPERPGHKRRRVTGTRWRICFTTTTPVFRLPRKLDRLPEKVRETQQWIYIEKIVPVPTQPARCITVDSPDHTYLVKQFIPTHNTVSMLYLADQFARLPNARGERTPVVIIDPKALALDTPLPTPTGQTQMGEIQVGDEVYGSDGKPCRVTHLSRVFERPDLYAVTFDDGQVIRADADHQWAVTELAIMHNGAGVAERRQRAVADAEIILRLIDGADGSHDVSVGEMFTIITNEGCRMWGSAQSLFRVLRREGCLPLSDLPRYRWNLQIALKTIHGVLDKAIWSHRPSERVVTTAEMLDQGVHQKSRSGQARFAVKTAKPFERPDVDLSVDPYILGVWLGDGRTKNKEIACGAEDVNAMVSSLSECWQNISVHPDRPGASLISLDRDFSRCLYGHDEYVDRKRGAGTSKHCKECWRVQTAAWSGRAEDTRKMVNPSLHHLLNDAGVIGNKHIPAVYQRASVAQRFALLQGIMDTDGTVKRSGSCRLVLTHKRLITDALELIRGLGYKATPWEGPATITEDDPENPGKKRLRVTGTAYCINFKTSDPVFRMQRKLDLLPKNIPVCSTWHYIQSIEPIESAPARCIVVDSPDHTYLAGQFIPTHNSGSDHSAAVMASGGRVASLDSLAAADGVFDPMRFAIRREVGVELASSMLMAVNPWGGEKLNYETPLIKALAYGSEAGADCIGQALKLALDGGAAPAEMVNRVLDLADASPMFRACVGMESGGPTLRTSEGITLIKVGDAHFDLPEPGAIQEVTQPQRVALALVRMMVFGSAMALTNRQGIIMLDEAWVFLGAGRSEVERLGRLARSQQVFPMLFTQRVTDALDAGLSGYISRGLILPIQDPEEAAAACELFRLEPTPERLQRLTARGTIGGTGDQAGAPNWGSMRALRDQETGEVLRGAIGVYVDLSGRAVPVEIKVPKSFFDRASTNPDDIRRRIALQEQPPLTETETYFQPVVEPLGGQTPVAVPPNPLEW